MMGFLPRARVEGFDVFSNAACTGLMCLVLVAELADRFWWKSLIQATILASNLLISVAVGGLVLHAGEAFETEMFYLLPLLVAAHFHGPRFVYASIAFTVVGYFAAQAGGALLPGADVTGILSQAVARALPVGTALGCVALLVHRLRQRDLAHREYLENLALTDPLTGLLNRRGLREAIESHSVEAGACTMMMVDLDHFKRINDREGHEVGDSVLTSVAAILRTSMRDSDLAIRMGGEEFLLLLVDRSVTEGTTLSEELSADLQKIPAAESVVRASYGITDWGQGEAFSDALRRADIAVYSAKARGRNQACVQPSPDAVPVPA